MHTTLHDTVEQSAWSAARARQRSKKEKTPRQRASLLSLVNMEIASGRVTAEARKGGRRHRDTAASRWSLPQFSRLVLRPPTRWTIPQSWREKPRSSAVGVALAGLLGALAASYVIAPDRLDAIVGVILEPVGEFAGESEALVTQVEPAREVAVPREPPAPIAPDAAPPALALVAAAPAPEPVVPGVAAPAPTVSRSSVSSRPTPRAAGPAPAPRPAAEDDLDSIFRDPPPPMSQLTAQAIVNGVKANAASGVYCLKAAVARGEIANGSHKLVLDWTIRPDGSVSVAQVVGPADMLRTSIPSCYGSAMQAWQFPATPRGAPVRNFPLAFSVR